MATALRYLKLVPNSDGAVEVEIEDTAYRQEWTGFNEEFERDRFRRDAQAEYRASPYLEGVVFSGGKVFPHRLVRIE